MDRSEQFRSFVDARYPAMVRTATLLAGSRASGEDLLQEALLRSYLSWSRVRDVGAAEAYVRTTMVRLLIKDRRRRWSGEVPTEPETMSAFGASGAAAAGDVATTGVAVRAALRRLPADQRAAIVLRFYADLSEAQIATELGVAAGTVKSRISRGMAALRSSGLLTDEELAISDPEPRGERSRQAQAWEGGRR